jgi:hypothetical protein
LPAKGLWLTNILANFNNRIKIASSIYAQAALVMMRIIKILWSDVLIVKTILIGNLLDAKTSIFITGP